MSELDSQYSWDKEIMLSPNAVQLIITALNEYQPEPWEASLRERLLLTLRAIK